MKSALPTPWHTCELCAIHTASVSIGVALPLYRPSVLLPMSSIGKSNGFLHTQHWCCMTPKMLGNIAISLRWRLVWRGLYVYGPMMHESEKHIGGFHYAECIATEWELFTERPFIWAQIKIDGPFRTLHICGICISLWRCVSVLGQTSYVLVPACRVGIRKQGMLEKRNAQLAYTKAIDDGTLHPTWSKWEETRNAW